MDAEEDELVEGNSASSAGKGHSISKDNMATESIRFDVCPPGTLQGNLLECPGPNFCSPGFSDDKKNHYLYIDNDFVGCPSKCPGIGEVTVGWEVHRGATECQVPCERLEQYYVEHPDPKTSCTRKKNVPNNMIIKFSHQCEWDQCKNMGVSDCYKGLELFSPSAVFRDGKYFGTKTTPFVFLPKGNI